MDDTYWTETSDALDTLSKNLDEMKAVMDEQAEELASYRDLEKRNLEANTSLTGALLLAVVLIYAYGVFLGVYMCPK